MIRLTGFDVQREFFLGIFTIFCGFFVLMFILMVILLYLFLFENELIFYAYNLL